MAVSWEIETLESGLRVVTTPVPTAQSVSVNVFVGVGSRAEDSRTNGLSHYLEHMMFKGTEQRATAIDIAEAIEGAGGVLNAYTSQEMTCYWNQVPFDKLTLAMDVLADMMQRSRIDAEEVDRERTVVQQEIRRAYDQPGAWAGHLLTQATFGDQPLGWPVAGTVDTVQELTRDDLINHISTWYVPKNMILSIAGNTTHREAVAAANELFADLSGQAPPPVAVAQEGIPSRNVVVESRDIAQSNLGIAMRALSRTDPDRYAAMILNAVLGRGMSSRLFKEVRERRGLAYSIGSRVARLTDIGTFIVSAGVTEDQQEEALTVIAEELQSTAEVLVDDEELQRAKDYAAGSFRLSLETSMAMGQRSGEQLLMDGEIESPEETVASIRAVTADDVRRVARGIFGERKFALTVVGPSASADRLAKILAA